ncbi:MAG: hypothetical protein A2Y10_13025 [Planctomycetes bacterium GWF2_41_51]|nr:MAG: hypothetical protein A2Y10_13025 [Planctomycetes bacterium GWF2_41_51]HBG60721.1 hypothetical protein [Candidatus Omnitrophota bacterium]
MVAPIGNSSKKVIKLLPQEQEGKYMFSSQFVSTRHAIDKFGEAVIIAAHIILLKAVKEKGGLDYLQVLEIDGQKLWFIDDVDHVTALLPEDY